MGLIIALTACRRSAGWSDEKGSARGGARGSGEAYFCTLSRLSRRQSTGPLIIALAGDGDRRSARPGGPARRTSGPSSSRPSVSRTASRWMATSGSCSSPMRRSGEGARRSGPTMRRGSEHRTRRPPRLRRAAPPGSPGSPPVPALRLLLRDRSARGQLILGRARRGDVALHAERGALAGGDGADAARRPASRARQCHRDRAAAAAHHPAARTRHRPRPRPAGGRGGEICSGPGCRDPSTWRWARPPPRSARSAFSPPCARDPHRPWAGCGAGGGSCPSPACCCWRCSARGRARMSSLTRWGSWWGPRSAWSRALSDGR